MAKKEKRAKTHKGGSGFMFVAAAALAAATFVYLKKKGIGKQHSQILKKHGRGFSALLKGESKAAYMEVREAVVEELASADSAPTKARLQRTVKDALTRLAKRGHLTKVELQALSEELLHDWQSISAEAKKQQKV